MTYSRNAEIVAKFIALADTLIRPEMTPSDYESVRETAGMIGKRYVRLVNDATARRAPFIKRR